LLSLFFYSNEQAIELTYSKDKRIPFSQNNDSAIQLTSSDLRSIIRFPAHTPILFKQTFGDTIYNYFQGARMEEAAFLLKQGGYSVSEAGYELGFSNLSHFSRLFKRRYGITQKNTPLSDRTILTPYSTILPNLYFSSFLCYVNFKR